MIKKDNIFYLIGTTFSSIESVIAKTRDPLKEIPANARNDISNEFDMVIIDEAGQSLISQGFICLGLAEKIVIFGDNKQLGPIISSRQ